jgi:hypothetical protein
LPRRLPNSNQQSDLLSQSEVTIHIDENTKIVDELLQFKKNYKNATDFCIQDDGMTPFYSLGEYVAGVNLFADQISAAIGSNCIITMETGDNLVRELRKGSLPNTYTLVCVNTRTTLDKPILYDVTLTSAAPIVLHRKKYVSPS